MSTPYCKSAGVWSSGGATGPTGGLPADAAGEGDEAADGGTSGAAPVWFGYLIAGFEFLAGLAILFGFKTRGAAWAGRGPANTVSAASTATTGVNQRRRGAVTLFPSVDRRPG